MRSANALLCLPKGAGIMPSGTTAIALLIDSLPSPSPDQCYHSAASGLDHFVAAEIKGQQIRAEAKSSSCLSVMSVSLTRRC